MSEQETPMRNLLLTLIQDDFLDVTYCPAIAVIEQADMTLTKNVCFVLIDSGYRYVSTSI